MLLHLLFHKRNRLAQDAVKQGHMFLKHVVPAAVKPVHTLWHEVIGFLFIVFAVIAGFQGYRGLQHYKGEPSDILRIVLCSIFVVIMLSYGISSFLKARKISRS